uniref:Endonuclease, Uma2 family (Restriction endonuclease fold) n=1 Tax=Candidatus Kentrum sp. TUN TaxID=2126343 RepID=A0A450ZD61_9GAMM|nr:MAG: Endonuclease, Uma2 family (restriction endonuclease fold) [Candidatus Kentron sp. TUN]VFK51721.1 MAG: Endonuclease, Uma2 family (restriction endonuclease fold) [Candidatus Kentron sp. TUN]
MAKTKPLLYISPEEYLQGEKLSEIRHEYLDGDVFAMAGTSEQHNRIALNLAFWLRSVARGGPCGVFMSDVKVRIHQGERFYYPDVMLVCDKDDNNAYYKDNPCLIAEVLSESTETIDRREKWLAYRAIPGLRYYLLVDSRRPEITWFRRTESGWEVGTLESGESLSVECPPYGAKLEFAEIYEDVIWP